MRKLIKVSLSATSLAALIACGGGDDTNTAAPVTTANTSAPAASTPGQSTSTSAPTTATPDAEPGTGSAAVFLAARVLSATYNLNNCSYVTNSTTNSSYTTSGGTATLTINSTGAISLASSAFGTAPNVVPALSENWNATNIAASEFFIGRSSAGALSYEFMSTRVVAVGANRPTIEAVYTPSATAASSVAINAHSAPVIISASITPVAASAPVAPPPVTTLSNSNRVKFTDENSNEFTCGYAADPQFTPRIANYNARIAQATSAITTIRDASTQRTLTSGSAVWLNGPYSNNGEAWARLNLSSGQLSSSATQTGTFADFNIANALSSSVNEASFKESLSGSAIDFTITENNTRNGFRFKVSPATRVDPFLYYYD